VSVDLGRRCALHCLISHVRHVLRRIDVRGWDVGGMAGRREGVEVAKQNSDQLLSSHDWHRSHAQSNWC
jgi:hypothetical protein